MGFYLFSIGMGLEKLRFVGAVPGLVGVALILYAIIARALTKHEPSVRS